MLRIILLIHAAHVTLVIFIVSSLRLNGIVVTGLFGFLQCQLHFQRQERDQVICSIQPRLNQNGRRVDNKRIHAAIILHHAQHAQHTAPRVAEQMEIVQAQRIDNSVVLVHPQIVIVEVFAHVFGHRLTAANLVIENDLAIILVGNLSQVKQVVMRISRATMQNQKRLLSRRAFAINLHIRLVTRNLVLVTLGNVVNPYFFHLSHTILLSRIITNAWLIHCTS